jgi:hypothetical protein
VLFFCSAPQAALLKFDEVSRNHLMGIYKILGKENNLPPSTINRVQIRPYKSSYLTSPTLRIGTNHLWMVLFKAHCCASYLVLCDILVNLLKWKTNREEEYNELFKYMLGQFLSLLADMTRIILMERT